ncbi:hypothetical protein J6590_028218 [Homalodisca vitripennis]|nr:hypothetical protein J6590_028218 [Homalodisca vitripennis]
MVLNNTAAWQLLKGRSSYLADTPKFTMLYRNSSHACAHIRRDIRPDTSCIVRFNLTDLVPIHVIVRQKNIFSLYFSQSRKHHRTTLNRQKDNSRPTLTGNSCGIWIFRTIQNRQPKGS